MKCLYNTQAKVKDLYTIKFSEVQASKKSGFIFEGSQDYFKQHLSFNNTSAPLGKKKLIPQIQGGLFQKVHHYKWFTLVLSFLRNRGQGYKLTWIGKRILQRAFVVERVYIQFLVKSHCKYAMLTIYVLPLITQLWELSPEKQPK